MFSVCHGYTSKAKHMAGFVHKFYTLGYNILAVDARAHGDSEEQKSVWAGRSVWIL